MIRSPRSRLDKLGGQAEMHVTLVGVGDKRFVRALHQRAQDIAAGRPKKDSEMILLLAEAPAALTKLRPLRGLLVPHEAQADDPSQGPLTVLVSASH